jgi:hypothetical protein
MEGINRAINIVSEFTRLKENVDNKDVPCFFISYQRKDQSFATEIADVIKAKKMDVYFDMLDMDLKFSRQISDPAGVTASIKEGLQKSTHMIVVVSPSTYESYWVPFEIGYAFDDMGQNLKVLRHKGIPRQSMPAYLQVKEVLQGKSDLFTFITGVRNSYPIYESVSLKESTRTFSEIHSRQLSQYLDE